jgi:hypothetical protein
MFVSLVGFYLSVSVLQSLREPAELYSLVLSKSKRADSIYPKHNWLRLQIPPK